jgi:hypothetical protein
MVFLEPWQTTGLVVTGLLWFGVVVDQPVAVVVFAVADFFSGEGLSNARTPLCAVAGLEAALARIGAGIGTVTFAGTTGVSGEAVLWWCFASSPCCLVAGLRA